MKLKDIKLLTTLFYDSRLSNRQIAKEIGVAKETVSARIQHFTDTGIIKGFSVKYSYEDLGFKEFNIFIRLKNININPILEFLISHDNTTWIGKTFGRYDLKVALILKNIDSIHQIISEISTKYEVDQIDYVLVIDKYKAPTHMFLNRLLATNLKQIDNKQQPQKTDYKPDEEDKKLLYLLGQDARNSLVNISKEMNITPEGLKYKINRLKKNGIIKGFGTVVDGKKFDMAWCLVLFKVKPDRIIEFKTYLKKQTFLSNYVETIGNWNFHIKYFSKSNEELYDALNTIRRQFEGHIIDIDLMFFMDFYKFPKTPKCIIK